MEHIIIKFIIIMLISYFAGSAAGAYYVVKLFTGQDIRKIKSGNVGATNAGRVLGKRGFLLTILIDAGKVFITLAIVSHVFMNSNIALVTSAIFLIIGHLYPVQLGFQGGKGVVVYLASALFLSPLTIVVMAIVMGTSYAVLRRYKVAGFVSMASIPLTAFWIEDSFTIICGLIFLFFTVVMSHNK
ncbi:glycerol-3-phosphate acyltransferase [Bacillus haikouensis]|uniref:glycerol-3-phosphate acyltransferase n=1 Tax=Bacillus haikouensis TaxID=1510468 RepID=UPI001553A5D9|nr:glycerol-3-phosphate acyltransferase [Bacillus haikouensis]NQD65320.1 glycerol-3-phosphate acyltransferase [Bacillus haikouensis]